jgi:hypothetical protein
LSVTEYVLPLGEKARKRHYHETDKGRIASFAVQLKLSEALTLADEDIKENWKSYQRAFQEGK